MPVPAGSRPRSRGVLARCERPGPGEVTRERAAPRLDLNRATPAELARVAGISWRLAARIVAARDAFEGGASPGASLDETPPSAGAAPASHGASDDPSPAVSDPESP
jgi:hypothetical protein